MRYRAARASARRSRPRRDARRAPRRARRRRLPRPSPRPRAHPSRDTVPGRPPRRPARWGSGRRARARRDARRAGSLHVFVFSRTTRATNSCAARANSVVGAVASTATPSSSPARWSPRRRVGPRPPTRPPRPLSHAASTSTRAFRMRRRSAVRPRASRGRPRTRASDRRGRRRTGAAAAVELVRRAGCAVGDDARRRRAQPEIFALSSR